MYEVALGLPPDIWLEIVFYLHDNVADILNLSQVNRFMHQVCLREALWERLFNQYWSKFLQLRPYLLEANKSNPTWRDKYIGAFKDYRFETLSELNYVKNIPDDLLTEFNISPQDINQTKMLLSKIHLFEAILDHLNTGTDAVINYSGGSMSISWPKSLTRIGKFSFKFSGFRNLITLRIEGYVLRDIPEEVFSLTKLHSLDLSYNAIASVPQNISKLVSLKTLILINNLLFEFPKSVLALTQLESLNLENNTDYVFHATCLDAIHGGPQRFTRDIMRNCYRIYFNKISSLPTEFNFLSNITFLALSNLNLKSIPDGILDLKGLEFLYIFKNKIECLPETLLSRPSLNIVCDHNPVWPKLFNKALEIVGEDFFIPLLRQDSVEIIRGGAHLSLSHLKFVYSETQIKRLAREPLEVTKLHSSLVPT